MGIKVKVLREGKKKNNKKINETSIMDDINSLIGDQEAQISSLSRKGRSATNAKTAQRARHKKELEAMKAKMGAPNGKRLTYKDWDWESCEFPTKEQMMEMANNNQEIYSLIEEKVEEMKAQCAPDDPSGRSRVADEERQMAASSPQYDRESFQEGQKKMLEEAFGLGELALAVMVNFGGTRVEIDKNDMKTAEVMMQQIEKNSEFSGVSSVEIRQEFDRMASEIRNNAKSKVDNNKDGLSDVEANFGIYDAADELASQIFLRADSRESAKPKEEIPATQGIGSQSTEQKDLFQRLKDAVGIKDPASQGNPGKPPKTSSNQKQVRDAVKAANKKARKKMMDKKW